MAPFYYKGIDTDEIQSSTFLQTFESTTSSLYVDSMGLADAAINKNKTANIIADILITQLPSIAQENVFKFKF
jgi:hypothetical protein